MGIRLLYTSSPVHPVRVVSSLCEHCLSYFDHELKFVLLLVDFDLLPVPSMCHDPTGLGYQACLLHGWRVDVFMRLL